MDWDNFSSTKKLDCMAASEAMAFGSHENEQFLDSRILHDTVDIESRYKGGIL